MQPSTKKVIRRDKSAPYNSEVNDCSRGATNHTIRRTHSTRTPASLMTFAHFGISRLM